MSLEHIGTVRGKPYLKVGRTLHYQVSHLNSARLPSLSTLTRDLARIVKTQEDLLHLCPEKAKLIGEPIESLH